MYTIRLADGTGIGGLSAKGSCFAREAQIDGAMFTDERLQSVTVESDGSAGDNPFDDGRYLVGTWQRKDLHYGGVFYDGTCGLWFLFLRKADKPDMKSEQIRADIEYIAMMAGVEL